MASPNASSTAAESRHTAVPALSSGSNVQVMPDVPVKYRRPPRSLNNPRNIHSTKWVSTIKPQDSHLICLPSELRTKIFLFALSSGDDSDTLYPRRRYHQFRNIGNSIGPDVKNALAYTCRLTYVDVVGAGLLYRNREVKFDDPRLLVRFLKRIGPTAREVLPNITVLCHRSYRNPYPDFLPVEMMQILGECTGLQTLTMKYIAVKPADYQWSKVLEVLDTLQKSNELKGLVQLKNFDFHSIGRQGNLELDRFVGAHLLAQYRNILSQITRQLTRSGM